MPLTSNAISLKPETLSVIKFRSQSCEICQNILAAMTEGALLSEARGISIDAQKKHIKLELAQATNQPKAAPSAPEAAPPSTSKEEAPPSKWPDNLSDQTVERLKERIPKDEDSPGCQLCKWIVEALAPGNLMRNHPVKDDYKQFPVKSQKIHLALEFGETEP